MGVPLGPKGLSCLNWDSQQRNLTRSLTPPNSKLVVTIPENLTLTENERSLLSKSLSFIPTRPRGDEYTAKADCESFYRHLHLKAHFHIKETEKDHTRILTSLIHPTGLTTASNPCNPKHPHGPHPQEDLLLLNITLPNVAKK